MSENNKSYRIRTNVGSEYNGDLKFDVNLLQDYDEFEILSLKIGTENLYKYHTSHYGCIVGRVLANGGVGVPNVKISSFIPVEDIDTADPVFSFLYPYTSTRDKNRDNIRYNLLTDTKLDDCHQAIGTFPNKRLVLDDNNVIEIYDKYYKFTTTTNGSGDYMLFGLPVGNNIIHSDLDLSDIGILSQKPRDLFYKGYTAKQFENASQFKKDTNLDNLTQVISQDSSVYVFPFWGDETENDGQIKIVRNDIDVNYKFEPTCIFIGCIVSDEKSNAISKNCIPHERMGKMDRLTTGAGTIEMIRKTVSGDIESISIQGNDLIDGNGTWCYQIPMNLDYVTTDEYGNLVPTDDYNKGLPTRTSVRFRVSLADYESDYENAHLVKVLVPNNPDVETKTVRLPVGDVNVDYVDYDYEFGSATRDGSFRDMFWNNVYTVKSYIPRFQKGNRQRNKNFTGFKAVNVNGANNPIPYNNMRINLTFLFVFQCLIFKSLVLIVKTLNKIIYVLNKLSCGGGCGSSTFTCGGDNGPVYLTLDGGMCPTLEGNFIAPGAVNNNEYHIIEHTYNNVFGEEYEVKPTINVDGDDASKSEGAMIVEEGTALPYDKKSSDMKNSDLVSNGSKTGIINKNYTPDDTDGDQHNTNATEEIKIYNKEDYFVKCVELQFAMEYEVIQFDFYNDWINGMIYIPRWFAEIKKNKDNMYYCGDTFNGNRLLTQQCSVAYDNSGIINNKYNVGCRSSKQQCHKRWGRNQIKIFGQNKGIVKRIKNSRGQFAYYLRPSELYKRNDNKSIKTNLFPTDIVLLGSVLDCNQYGIPKVNGYTSSTYRMPPPTAEIISDTQEMNLKNIDMHAPEQATKLSIEYLNTLNRQTFNKYMEKYLKDLKLDDAKQYLQSWYTENKDKNGFQLADEYCKTIGYKYSLKTIKDIEKLFTENKYEKGNWGKEWHYNKEDKCWVGTSCERINELCDNYNNKLIIDLTGKKIQNPLLMYINTIQKETFNGPKTDDRCKRGNNNVECAYNKYVNLINNTGIKNDITIFYEYEKSEVYGSQKDDSLEKTYSEVAGIDWGYNPFDSGNDDNTTYIKNQVAGHFLEIGCTFSLSNIKSCVNLQRVCEIGGEISQSHYYYKPETETNGRWYLLDPTGIIAKREVSDAGIRTTFATLNSRRLKSIYDNINGYKKYIFTPYNPVSFMGDLSKRSEIAELTKTTGTEYKNYGLIENQSLSYKAFRFGATNNIENKFLIKENGVYYMPQYENSFYFYFGLRDGNTAIDRLYTEYYAPCDVNSDTPSVSFSVDVDTNEEGFKYQVRYRTKNMGFIKWITLRKKDGSIPVIGVVWYKDTKNSIIGISKDYPGTYIATLKDNRGQKITGTFICEGA